MFLALIFLAFGVAVHVEAVITSGPAWTWQTSQELFRTILENGTLTECQWSLKSGNIVSPGSQYKRSPVTGYGLCAANIETCIHLGTVPRPVTDSHNTVNCTVCCARSTCISYEPSSDEPWNGYCMLPEILPIVTAALPTAWTLNYTGSPADQTPVYPSNSNNTGYGWSWTHTEEVQTCLNIGGSIGTLNDTWWGVQCPMSGRCCLYPETIQCETCGSKYGKEWNWSKLATVRTDTQDEMLAWKTAVNQMAGTGWNLGMQPVATPGFAEQYSQSPPTYDSLVPPQLWNNFLNRPNAGSKKTETDDDDEDEHRGWCWQAAILSKLDGSLRCGGALIAERFILTTASCASFTSDSFSNYGVRLGGTDLRKGDDGHAVDLDIAEIFIHPQFNSSTWSNNIALIELRSAVSCNNKYICTICLPSVNIMGITNLAIGQSHEQWIREDIHQCLATGWGRKTAGINTYNPYLKEMVYAPVFNNQTYCAAEYSSTGSIGGAAYGTGSFCAVPQPTVQGKMVPICQGDNGGPLACFYGGRYYLTGLTWGGNKCDYVRKTENIVAKMLQPNYKGDLPGTHVDFFTDVVKFIPWIYGIIYNIA